MAHVADWKQGETKSLVALLTSHKIIGIIDIGGIPAPQLQKIRGNIRKKATIRSAKNTLIVRALDGVKLEIDNLVLAKPSLDDVFIKFTGKQLRTDLVKLPPRAGFHRRR